MQPKILIVDDSKSIRMQVRGMLPEGNFNVLEAKDGAEGLDLIRRQRPSLILLDCFMPKMNGWEVLQKMQDQPELKAIPLVVMSGRKEEVAEKVPELFEYFEFIEKPFEQKALLRAIKSATTKAKDRQKTTVAPVKSDKSKTESSTASTEEIWALKAEIQALNAKNANIQSELNELKKQMNRVLAFLKQKLK